MVAFMGSKCSKSQGIANTRETIIVTYMNFAKGQGT